VGVELETGWGTCVGEMITSEVNTESADAKRLGTVTLRSHVGHDGSTSGPGPPPASRTGARQPINHAWKFCAVLILYHVKASLLVLN
jgi:hypothetical protein